ncbi:hypothetical protein [Amycolatopsis sp. cmx-11-51]|uniref:hypothetical protein n=1 Tax=unclassified Amycolatopsis TaxID=2618356 RepID=UPI0039E25183
MTHSRTMPPIDDVPARTVICLVVRSGITGRASHALLDGAISYARSHRDHDGQPGTRVS